MYLHKSVFQSHGYLSSANCHVDSRWVLKISGFALSVFKMENCADEVSKHTHTLGLFACLFATIGGGTFHKHIIIIFIMTIYL